MRSRRTASCGRRLATGRCSASAGPTARCRAGTTDPCPRERGRDGRRGQPRGGEGRRVRGTEPDRAAGSSPPRPPQGGTGAARTLVGGRGGSGLRGGLRRRARHGPGVRPGRDGRGAAGGFHLSRPVAAARRAHADDRARRGGVPAAGRRGPDRRPRVAGARVPGRTSPGGRCRSLSGRRRLAGEIRHVRGHRIRDRGAAARRRRALGALHRSPVGRRGGVPDGDPVLRRAWGTAARKRRRPAGAGRPGPCGAGRTGRASCPRSPGRCPGRGAARPGQGVRRPRGRTPGKGAPVRPTPGREESSSTWRESHRPSLRCRRSTPSPVPVSRPRGRPSPCRTAGPGTGDSGPRAPRPVP